MTIEFEATFGDEVKLVTVSWDEWGHKGFNILLNKRYQGYVIKHKDIWDHWLQVRYPQHDFTTDDIQIIIALIEAHPDYETVSKRFNLF
ncbi:hypothetical protein MTO98_26670 [Mucilaginibacter sp. SMC90]|uniref:hypothetical protein n=1 Tax=Mucilaginibacter sp. SMC90 TaxID=2929803 RepID=UPI001FB2816D|nr:hypothetical protein [Mucilaginibacter sp. SMC90]UOE47999.1 hypothetical protein MTO98_26670 [Mucilaginibacter sp. SMC90]